MAFWNFKKKPKPIQTLEERALNFPLGYNSISSYGSSQASRLSAVYAATNMISNSCALLPMKVIKYTDGKKKEINHPLYKILNLTPNKTINHFNFMKLLIESLILTGNGYAYIERDDKLNVKSLQLINSSFVTPQIQPDGRMKYIVAGMDKLVDDINMIHLYQHCDDLGNGISVIKYAEQLSNFGV